MLNFIWAAFFIVGFICAVFRCFFVGDFLVWQELSTALFDTAKTAFLISINLTGVLCLWLGMLKIAEKAGLTSLLAQALAPLFRKIMPDVPQNHPALGSIVMNMAANMLGLDNAATPMGLKAMEQLQELNPKKNIDFNITIETDPLLLYFDKEIITIILDNLISNAIKYTEKGFVELNIKCINKNVTNYENFIFIYF